MTCFWTNESFLFVEDFSHCSLFRYLDAIERAVSNGDTLFLENIGENVDAVLDPLLGRLTIKKGRYIKIGDKEVEYHPKFRCEIYNSLLERVYTLIYSAYSL